MQSLLRRVVLAGAMLAPASYVAAAPPVVEFKGTPLGVPVEQFIAAQPAFSCVEAGQTPCDVFEVWWNDPTNRTIANRPVHTLMAKALDGRFASVRATFDVKYFDDIKTALLSKYGQPIRVKTTTVSNALGGRFANRELIWDFPTGSISLTEREGKIDESMLLISSAAFGKYANDRAKARTEAAKKDL